MTLKAALVVIAKAPAAGLSKTRLCPPCTPEQAAALAEAALRDTLVAAAATPAARRVLLLEGAPGSWAPEGFEVVPQRGSELGERLTAGFDDIGVPALIVAADVPQVTPALLQEGLEALLVPDTEAVLGPTEDGGYWAIGLRRSHSGVFDGVPMSTSGTLDAQRDRLTELGLARRELPCLRDVDSMADALAVAWASPATRFAGAVAALPEPARRAPSPVAADRLLLR